MSFINAVLGIAVLICFFVAVSRLGQIRDELRYQSKQAETSHVWNEFRKLCERVREIEREKDPESEDLKMPEDRLRRQLQEEINLLGITSED
jgi:hypothetical protein